MKIARPMFARPCLGHISRCCHTVPIFLAYDAAVLCIVLSCNVMSIHLYNHYQCIYRRLRKSESVFPRVFAVLTAWCYRLLTSFICLIVCSPVWSFGHIFFVENLSELVFPRVVWIWFLLGRCDYLVTSLGLTYRKSERTFVQWSGPYFIKGLEHWQFNQKAAERSIRHFCQFLLILYSLWILSCSANLTHHLSANN